MIFVELLIMMILSWYLLRLAIKINYKRINSQPKSKFFYEEGELYNMGLGFALIIIIMPIINVGVSLLFLIIELITSHGDDLFKIIFGINNKKKVDKH